MFVLIRYLVERIEINSVTSLSSDRAVKGLCFNFVCVSCRHIAILPVPYFCAFVFEYGNVGAKEARYTQGVSPATAALLNSSFVQANELDDFHPTAPLHSLSILLPALLATSSPINTSASSNSPAPFTGAEFLLALIIGLEVGPRVGNALHGTDLLESGWHCGTVFGHPVAAAAVSKLFRLNKERTEWAIGIASTQSCGLMSAQYGGMVKRMQHGFAARAGLIGVR